MLVTKQKLLVVLLASLAGCASNGTFEETRSSIDGNRKSVDSGLQRIESSKTDPAVVVRQDAKVIGDSVSVKPKPRLPSVFNEKFIYVSTPRPLSGVLGDISMRTGIPIVLQGSKGLLGGRTGGSTEATSSTDPKLSVDWNGTLKGLLDHLSVLTGLYWKYDQGSIHFAQAETRTFYVNLPQISQKTSTSISLGGTGGGGGGGMGGGASSGGSSGSSIAVSSDYSIEALNEIKKTIESIIASDPATNTASSGSSPSITAGGSGGMGGFMGFGPSPSASSAPQQSGNTPSTPSKVVVNPALGTIIVTASPEKLDEVEKYVESVNKMFSQNILIDLKIYSVKVRKGANVGAALLAAYTNNNETVQLVGNPILQPSSGAPGQITFEVTGSGSRWLGTRLTLEALKSVGDVSLRTSGQVLAVNGYSTPMKVTRAVSYLSRVGTVVSGQSGTTTTTLEPSTIEVGVAANFLPRILADGRILLQYQLNVSSLNGIRQFSSGEQTIQLPDVSTQSLQQQTYVKDGQGIVLFGYEQEDSGVEESIGLGGASRASEKGKAMMVILMEVYSGK